MATRKKKAARKKRAASKTKAVAKRAHGALAPALQDKFARFIKRDAAAGKVSDAWPFIRTAGGQMKAGGQLIGDRGEEVDLVVVAAVRSNLYFEDDYADGQANAPVCAAVDLEGDEDSMRPFDNASDPQSEDCASCWANKFRSGKGQGKACRNSVTLVVFPPDADPGEADGMRLSVPPGSLKDWGKYVKKVRALGRPIFAVVTRVTIERRGGAWGMAFTASAPLDDETALDAWASRAEGDAWEQATAKPDLSGESRESEPTPPTRGGSRKKSARKRGRARAAA